jgi:hypothetical protein
LFQFVLPSNQGEPAGNKAVRHIQFGDAFPASPGQIADEAGAFGTVNCKREGSSMPTLVLRETIPTVADASVMPAPHARKATPRDRSFEGVLIFSGIGFGLMILAATFGYLQLPAPVF